LLSVAGALVPLAPASGEGAADVPKEAVLAEIDFQKSDEVNRIFVDLAPEGARAFPLMLDTGATFSVLSPRLARDLGVSVRAIKDSPYRRATLLGRDLQFWVDVTSSDTGTRMGWEYGLLGGNFLEEYVVELDFAARKVRFLDPDRFTVPATTSLPGETVVPMRIISRRPAVPLSLNGKPLDLLLDTGAPGSILLSGTSAEATGVSAIPDTKIRTSLTVGPVDTLLAQIERLGIGGFELAGVPAMIAPTGDYNVGVPSNSIVGYDVLALFLVRLDYRSGRLWLRRRADVKPTLYGVDWAASRAAGAVVYSQQPGLEVLAVLPDSPAQRRGLRVGDLLRWQGDEHDEVSGARDLLGDVAEGRKVRVVRTQDDLREEIVLEPLAAVPVADPPPPAP
jgi:predicted aspartyl protease